MKKQDYSAHLKFLRELQDRISKDTDMAEESLRYCSEKLKDAISALEKIQKELPD